MKKYGVDTNVVLRLIVNDHAGQRKAALRFGAGLGVTHRGYLTLISLIELDWALRSKYGYGREQSTMAIRSLLHIRGLEIESHDVVTFALRIVEQEKADFADALIALKSSDAGCTSIMTSDQQAAKTIPGMELLT